MEDVRLDEPSEVRRGEARSVSQRFPRQHSDRRLRPFAELALYAGAAALSLVFASLAVRLSQADFGIPLVYRGDAVAILSHFKTIQETGWYEYQSRLGAPYGQTFHDFPTADNLHFIVAKMLLLVANHVGTAVNVYYLAGFPLAAMAAVWFLRVCGVSRALSVALAVLFSLAPYHFFRNESHLWLASYYPIPLALVVVVWIIRGEPLWVGRGSAGPWRWFTGRGAATVVILILLGTASTYYAAFILVLLATAGVVALTRSGDFRRFGGAVSAGLVLVATLVVNMTPDALYERSHGLNTMALSRNPVEVEVYALKLTSLLTPIPGHRIDSWNDLKATYETTYPNPSELHSLGLVASLGFLVLLVVAVIGLGSEMRRRRAAGAVERQPVSMLLNLASLNLIAFLCATMGGFATVLSLVTGNLRAWNRISIVLAALSLAALGLVLDLALRRLRRASPARARTHRLVAVGLASSVLMAGVWDQTGVYAVPDYAGTAAEYAADAQWYGQLEDTLPEGSMIFQLPYFAYPESPVVNTVSDTDQMKPFLHSTTLRWSAGGIKGRAASDWPRLVSADDPKVMVGQLAASGFAGILLDRRALGTSDLEARLQAVLGMPRLVRSDDRFAYYDLTEARTAIEVANDASTVDEVAQETLSPTIAYPDRDIDVTYAADGKQVWTAGSPSSALVLDNARHVDAEVSIDLTLTMARVLPVPGAMEQQSRNTEVRLTFGAQDWLVPLTNGVAQKRITVVAPPGRSSLGVVAGPGSSDLLARERRIEVTSVSVERTHVASLAY